MRHPLFDDRRFDYEESPTRPASSSGATNWRSYAILDDAIAEYLRSIPTRDLNPEGLAALDRGDPASGVLYHRELRQRVEWVANHLRWRIGGRR